MTANERELIDIIRNSKDPVKTFEFALSLVLEAITEENAKNLQ